MNLQLIMLGLQVAPYLLRILTVLVVATIPYQCPGTAHIYIPSATPRLERYVSGQWQTVARDLPAGSCWEIPYSWALTPIRACNAIVGCSALAAPEQPANPAREALCKGAPKLPGS